MKDMLAEKDDSGENEKLKKDSKEVDTNEKG